MKKFGWVPVLAGLCVSTLNAKPSTAQTYQVTDLGTLGGATSSANAINEVGQVVGQADLSSGTYHAFLWQRDSKGNGAMRDLNAVNGAAGWSIANAVNESGVVVGQSSLTATTSGAFYWNGQMNAQSGPSGSANGINDQGSIAGKLRSTSTSTIPANTYAVLWQAGGQVTNLIEPYRTIISTAYDVNNKNCSVGFSFPSTLSLAFFHNGSPITIGALSGDNSSVARALNESNQVVGESWGTSGVRHGFLWSQAAGISNLGTLGGASANPRDINASGQVVGVSQTSAGVSHAFLWTKGTAGAKMRDLNDMIPADSGWVLTSANGLNDKGQIVGAGTYNGQQHAFLLEGQPASITVQGAGTCLPTVIDRKGYILGRKISKVPLTISVADGSGPLPNYPLSIRVVPDPKAGGHDHGSAGRPHGWVIAAKSTWEPARGGASGSTANPELATISTDADGVVEVVYIAPEMGGTDQVVIESAGVTGAKKLSATHDITARAGDFQELVPGTNIELIGGTDNHSGEHNHFGTAQLLTALRALAKNYVSEKKGQPLPINDMSLPLGGLFDIGPLPAYPSFGFWAPPHGGHRNGVNVDIGIRYGWSPDEDDPDEDNPGEFVVSPAGKAFAALLEEQGWWKISPKLWRSDGGGSHFHLQLEGSGQATVKLISKSKRLVNATTGVYEATYIFQNRGGLAATSVNLDGISVTGGVEVRTPMPLPLGSMSIRQQKTAVVRFKVPPQTKTFVVSFNLSVEDSNGTQRSTQTLDGNDVSDMMTLLPGPFIIGQVTDRNGNGIAGVTMKRSDGAATLTDEEGIYGFAQVPMGSYAVTPSKAGWGFIAPSKKVTIAAGKSATVLFTGVKAPYIIGRVLEGTDEGAEGVEVAISGATSASSITGADGYYAFGDLPAGDYTIAPTLMDERFDAFLPAARVITISGSTGAGAQDFRGLAGPWISGSIKNSLGEPVRNATVLLLRSGTQIGQATTDAAGYYSLLVETPGDYTVQPQVKDLTPVPAQQAVSVAESAVSNVNFTFKITDNTGPSLTVTSPANNLSLAQTRAASLLATGQVSDNAGGVGLASDAVQIQILRKGTNGLPNYYFDGQAFVSTTGVSLRAALSGEGNTRSWRYRFPGTDQGLTPATYQIKVTGRDRLGNNAIPVTNTLIVTPDPSMAPPSNDNFSQAKVLSGDSGSYIGTNAYATVEGGEPKHNGQPFSSTVWFRWTAPKTGKVSFEFDQHSWNAALYQGTTLQNLTRLTGSATTSNLTTLISLSASVQAGKVYYLAIGSCYPATEDIFHRFARIRLSWEASWVIPAIPTPPVNDDFDKPVKLSGSSGQVNGTNIGATVDYDQNEPDDWNYSVWYSWTAPASGYTTFEIRHDGVWDGQALSVFTGDYVGELSLIRSSSVARGATTNNQFARVSFNAVKGTTYKIAVFWAANKFTLSWKPGHLTAQPNDLFAKASVITGPGGTVAGSSWGATSEPGEPRHAGLDPLYTIWYRWQAPASGAATFNTFGSIYDTNLAVYQGSSLTSLKTIAANATAYPQEEGSNDAEVTFQAVAGTTYYIAIDANEESVYLDHGITLNWRSKGYPRPANDSFATPEVIKGASGTTSGQVIWATAEAGEPMRAGGRAKKSVWYSWTAPFSGTVSFDTNVPFSLYFGFDSILSVYTGATLDKLKLVAENDNISDDFNTDLDSQVSFPCTLGTTYRIAVDSKYGELYNDGFVLRWKGQSTDKPANDNLADATVIAGANGVISGTDMGATQEPQEPLPQYILDPSSVWYKWTAPDTGKLRVKGVNSANPVDIVVYLASATMGLQVVEGDYTDQLDSLVVPVKEGQTYYIGVYPDLYRTGRIELQWDLIVQPPANDDFYYAQTLTGTSGTVQGSTLGATLQIGEAGVETTWITDDVSVWYRWVAPASGMAQAHVDNWNTTTETYEGTDFWSLALVPTNYPFVGYQKEAFWAEAGKTYYFRVYTYDNSVQGDFTLTYSVIPATTVAQAATLEQSEESELEPPSDKSNVWTKSSVNRS